MTFSSTSWILIVYLIKENITFFDLPIVFFDLIILFLPILISFFSLLITKSKSFGLDQIGECTEFSLADNQFLPVYLGYFFVSLSISDFKTLFFVYVIIFVFVWHTQVQYFNPSYLLLKYHFYLAKTKVGTNLLVISRGPVKRNIGEFHFANLKRINNTTYLEINKNERESKT